jgi:hypothetical protein
MSLSFNYVSFVDLQPNIIHKYTFAVLHDLVDSIHFFYQKSFFPMEFWKIKLVFLFQNWINVYFEIILIERQMNQATPSLRWLNSKQKYMNRKMSSHPHTMTLEPNVLIICIMVCSGFIIHRLMKCISLQSPNHYTRRDQSLLILTVCAWNEEMPSLLSFSYSKMNISLVISF